eukprot:3908774-Prymnesium_polylepis.1
MTSELDPARTRGVRLAGSATHLGGPSSNLWHAIPIGEAIFASDRTSHSIKVFDMQTGQLSAEFGEDVLREPVGLCASGDGTTLYVVDWGDGTVKVFDAVRRSFKRSYGSPGSGPSNLCAPAAVAVHDTDEDVELYVVSRASSSVQVFSVATGSHLRTLGRKGSGDGQMSEPRDVVVSADGLVLICDAGNSRIL